jgi:hypothetical protein
MARAFAVRARIGRARYSATVTKISYGIGMECIAT